MKVKLLTLFGLTLASAFCVTQAQTEKPFLYNKGSMSVIGNDTTGVPVLYVNGDFISGRDETDRTLVSDIYVSKSKIILTGDFVQKAVYKDGDLQGANVFRLTDGDYAKFVFRNLTEQQSIRNEASLGVYNALSKGQNYVGFPDLEVVNPNGVRMDAQVGASVEKLLLTKGKLILDSRRLQSGDLVSNPDVNNGGMEGANRPNASNASLLAHLKVNKGVVYNKTANNVNDLGVVEVRMAVDEETPAGTDESTHGHSIIGMGSPFKEIKADYFMWNTLLFPDNVGIFGKTYTSIQDPFAAIPAGKGIIVGVDLAGTDVDNYIQFEDYTETDFAARQVEMFTFNRFQFNNANNLHPTTVGGVRIGSQLAKYPTNATAYANEELNVDDVEVGTLPAGYSYLSNPFTTPLSLKSIIQGGDPSSAGTGWGVRFGPSSDTERQAMNRVWILNPTSVGNAKYKLNENGSPGAPLLPKKIYVKYSFLLMKEAGSTFSDGAGDGYTIAPLQMFVVYSPKGTGATKLTIPKKHRTIKAGSIFLRSANTNPFRDDFLFQVSDLKTNTYDRAAVVLRTPDEIMSNSAYDNAPKLIMSLVSDNTKKSGAEFSYKMEEGQVTDVTNSTLYTKGTDGKALESYVLPAPEGATEVTTTLYMAPSAMAQDISIRGLRLNSRNRVGTIWLEDKLTNKKFDLTSGGEYITSVKPTDKDDRFTLRFVMGTSGIEDEIETSVKSITSYYDNNQLTVSGFSDEDMGSTISIYDIQGRLFKQAQVDDVTVVVPVSLTPGAYIVKVLGNKSYVSKFLVR